MLLSPQQSKIRLAGDPMLQELDEQLKSINEACRIAKLLISWFNSALLEKKFLRSAPRLLHWPISRLTNFLQQAKV